MERFYFFSSHTRTGLVERMLFVALDYAWRMALVIAAVVYVR